MCHVKWYIFLQVVNPKLAAMASRSGGFGGNRGGRWGYGNSRGRENSKPSHVKFGNKKW